MPKALDGRPEQQSYWAPPPEQQQQEHQLQVGHQVFQVQARVRVPGQEAEVLRERQDQQECARRHLLRRQPQVLGRRGGGGRRRQLRRRTLRQGREAGAQRPKGTI